MREVMTEKLAEPSWVDAHTHLLPERLAGAIRRFFLEKLQMTFDYPVDAFAARDMLRKAGVTRCWSLPYAHKPGMASGLNRWMAEAFAKDDLVQPGATVHPGDDVEAVVREATEMLGLRLFKIHCSVGNFAPDDPRLDALYSVSAERGMPITVHVGMAIDGNTRSADLAPLGRALERHPNANIVLAHLGAPSVQESLALMRKYPSLRADVTPVLRGPVTLATGDVTGLTGRLLFGSDVPNTLVPLEATRASLVALGLGAEELAAVLGGNARRILDAVA
jgi:predicted TIM-barrel fold metal-dependent hydrolase